MRSNIDGARMNDNLLFAGNRMGVYNATLTGTLTLANGAPHILMLDPGGAARTVKLPASPQDGDFFILFNTADALEVITVQDSAGTGLTPACTPTQSECAVIAYSSELAAWKSFVGAGA